MIDNLSILYVEDDDVVRESFEQILQLYFSKVIVADNGKSALELYSSHKPDLAILDISIPHLSGLDVAAKIRAENTDIPIIMLTAFADQDKLLKAVNLQLFAYLVKPVSQSKLDKTLHKVKKKLLTRKLIRLSSNYIWDSTAEALFYQKEAIKLTLNESKIIALLCLNPNKYYTAANISEHIFDDENEAINNDSTYNNIVQIMSRLKKKLIKKYASDSFFIENTYSAGYKIIKAK
jgi:DNA-binding response OmpR family regulator